MKEQLKLFEEATKETLERWKNTPGQRENAEVNVEYAIIYALNDNFYRGFTSQGNARNKAIGLGKDGITYALLHNTIQLSDYRHQNANESLGWMDSFITAISSSINQGDIAGVEEMFYMGLSEMATEQKALQQYNITDQKEVEIQRQRMREVRERTDKRSQVAYQYADCIVSSYAWFHTSYQTVQADKPIQTFYDKHAEDNLTSYYQMKQATSTSNIQK